MITDLKMYSSIQTKEVFTTQFCAARLREFTISCNRVAVIC